MICKKCGADMLLKEKDGSQFWGCPNWKTKGCKTMPYSGTGSEETRYTKPETAPEEKVQEMADRIENIETILIGEGQNAEKRETAIGNLALAIDGLKEELNKRIDGIGKWIENNVK